MSGELLVVDFSAVHSAVCIDDASAPCGCTQPNRSGSVRCSLASLSSSVHHSAIGKWGMSVLKLGFTKRGTALQNIKYRQRRVHTSHMCEMAPLELPCCMCCTGGNMMATQRGEDGTARGVSSTRVGHNRATSVPVLHMGTGPALPPTLLAALGAPAANMATRTRCCVQGDQRVRGTWL